jgi:hypothetical protein
MAAYKESVGALLYVTCGQGAKHLDTGRNAGIAGVNFQWDVMIAI